MGPGAPRRASLPLLLAAGASLCLLVAVGGSAVALLGGVTIGRGAVADAGAGRPAPTHDPSPGRPLAIPLAGPVRVVRAGGARFAVPRSPEWSVAAAGTVVGTGRGPGAAPGSALTGPAYLRRGWCPEDPRWSNRGLVGVVAGPLGAGSTGGPGAAARRAAARWRDALARPGGETGRVRVRPVRLADGTPGWLASVRTRVAPTAGACAPPAVAVAALRVPAPGGGATVVALRDVGVPGALPAATVRRILAGVRVAGAGPA